MWGVGEGWGRRGQGHPAAEGLGEATPAPVEPDPVVFMRTRLPTGPSEYFVAGRQ